MDAWLEMQRQNPKKWGSPAHGLKVLQSYERLAPLYPRHVKFHPDMGVVVTLKPVTPRFTDEQLRYFRWAKRALKVARFMGCQVHA
jgi:hypothetical protein